MSQRPAMVRIVSLVVLAVLLAGCTAPPPAPVPETGSVQVTSSPSGADVYFNGVYSGTTPITIVAVMAGNHTVELRLDGYTRWSGPVTVTAGSITPLPVQLASMPVTQPVTVATPPAPVAAIDIPDIHVDGYWTYPAGQDSTTNPVLLLVHTEAFNVGSTDARVVTVSANFYYDSRMVCWNTLYLGTLKAGGHVARDSMVSCTLPLPRSSQDLVVRFENLVVTQ